MQEVTNKLLLLFVVVNTQRAIKEKINSLVHNVQAKMIFENQEKHRECLQHERVCNDHTKHFHYLNIFHKCSGVCFNLNC